jgi:hypothetical protein
MRFKRFKVIEFQSKPAKPSRLWTGFSPVLLEPLKLEILELETCLPELPCLRMLTTSLT